MVGLRKELIQLGDRSILIVNKLDFINPIGKNADIPRTDGYTIPQCFPSSLDDLLELVSELNQVEHP